MFPGEPFDEGWKVQRLTESLGIEPAAFEVEPQGALWLALKHVQRWGQPLLGAGGLVESAIMNEAAREGVEVMLDGQTGDETLGFAPYLLSDLLRHGRLIAALRLTGRWPLGHPATPRERRWVLKHVGLKGALPYRLGNAAESCATGTATAGRGGSPRPAGAASWSSRTPGRGRSARPGRAGGATSATSSSRAPTANCASTTCVTGPQPPASSTSRRCTTSTSSTTA